MSPIKALRIRLGRWRAGVAILVACAACAPPGSEQAQGDLPRWTLVEDLRLDANAEDFSVVRRVIVGPHGMAAIPLPQDMEIRLYDSAGRRIGAFGRPGEGPGEFRHLGPITWLGDTLVVGDVRQMRVTYLTTPQGAVLDTHRLPHPLAYTTFRAGSDSTFRFISVRGALPGGDLIGVARVGIGESMAGRPQALLSLAKDGSARVVAVPPQTSDERWMITIDGLSNWIPLALQPQTVFAADGSRFAFMTADQGGEEGTYSIAAFDAKGDAVFERQYPFQGVPIPSSVIDSAIAAMVPETAQREEGGPDPSRFQAAARERMPRVYSPVETIMLAADSTTWITMRPTADGAYAIVLDARGTPLASVPLPPESRIQHATGTHVWMTETDEYDLTSAVRYRIERP